VRHPARCVFGGDDIRHVPEQTPICIDILKFVFLSECDRFSYKNCTVYETEGVIKGFSFTYHYDEVNKMKEFWYGEIISYFGLKEDTIIFDYDEVLQGEFYLDTLFVFSNFRGEGIGNKLLTEFVNSGEAKLSLNVAQSNNRARKLYESYGFKKECEIFIGHEEYDHLIKRK